MTDLLDHTRKELQLTIRSIAETKATLKHEHIQHRDAVEDLKDTIKKTKIEILAIKSETFPSAVEARAVLAEKQSAQMLDIQSKRAAIESEIDELKQRINKDKQIQTYKVSSLEREIQELQLRKADVLSKNDVEMEETALELRKLTEEYSKNKTVLDQLEQRLEVEQKQQKELEQQEAARMEEETNIKALEETKHYAALRIALRWKSFKKRQLLKLNTKGKKGKKKGAKKKKS